MDQPSGAEVEHRPNGMASAAGAAIVVNGNGRSAHYDDAGDDDLDRPSERLLKSERSSDSAPDYA